MNGLFSARFKNEETVLSRLHGDHSDPSETDGSFLFLSLSEVKLGVSSKGFN